MKTMGRRGIVAIFGALFLSVASVGQAQTGDANGTAGSGAAQPAAGEPAYWDLVGGMEFDTHGTSYSYFGPSWIKPVRENLAFQLRVSPNYLTYEFDDGNGITRVRRPGLSITPGIKFGTSNWVKFGVGLGFKHKNAVQVRNGIELEETDWETGVDLNSDVYANPTDRVNLHGAVSYGTADGYLWSRLGVKRQLTNIAWDGRFAHYLGGEVMSQGNEDARQLQLGALVEFLHAPSSMSFMLRGGFKRTSYEFADDKTGPYIGIGVYRRMR